MSNENNSPGIRIKTASRIGVLVGFVIFILVIFSISKIENSYDELEGRIKLYSESQGYLADLQRGSDYMTAQTRLFVVTQNGEYMTRYFKTVDGEYRNEAVRNLTRLIGDNESYQAALSAVRTAFNESNALMEYELHAMKLISQMKSYTGEKLPPSVSAYKLPEAEQNLSDEAKRNLAFELIYGEKYLRDKGKIDKNIQESLATLGSAMNRDSIESTVALKESITTLKLLQFISLIILVALFGGIAILILRPLNLYVKAIKAGKAFEVTGAYEVKYLALTYNNIFEINRAAQAQLRYKMEHDALTNVLSRHAFEECRSLLEGSPKPMGFLIVDVDQFKSVNDKYGHEAGDAALVRVATLLKQSFRGTDIIARFGGDEFVVLLVDMAAKERAVLERTLKEINERLKQPGENEMPLSVSMGVAFSEAGYTEDLMRHADEALYYVKEHGRANHHFYEET
ncbi:MAG: GGDEF domain-containing protein [Selenomonadaceae bacterium]|nr:GGDEF domain-containing protein [Selenomonadaceae bacterium]